MTKPKQKPKNILNFYTGRCKCRRADIKCSKFISSCGMFQWLYIESSEAGWKWKYIQVCIACWQWEFYLQWKILGELFFPLIHRSLEENTHAIISVIVFSNPPEKFKSAVKDFYLKAFKAHQGLSNDDETLEGGNVIILILISLLDNTPWPFNNSWIQLKERNLSTQLERAF